MSAELMLFEVDDGESWWIVAKSPEDALKVAREYYEIPADPDEEVVVTALDLDALKTIGWGDDGWDPLPEGAIVEEHPTNGMKKVTATVRAWVAIHSEGDLVCSTCC